MKYILTRYFVFPIIFLVLTIRNIKKAFYFIDIIIEYNMTFFNLLLLLYITFILVII